MSASCNLVATCWERIGLLALLYVMLSCVFVTFQYGVLGQVWYLIVSIPDLCLLPYFQSESAAFQFCICSLFLKNPFFFSDDLE